MGQILPKPKTKPYILKKEKQIKPGKRIYSKSREFELNYQDDGNLVIYRHQGGNRSPIWSTKTNGTRPGRVVMQADGNFVAYSESNQPVFATGTNGRAGAYIVMQDDGNLVLYCGDPVPPNAIWASNSACR